MRWQKMSFLLSHHKVPHRVCYYCIFIFISHTIGISQNYGIPFRIHLTQKSIRSKLLEECLLWTDVFKCINRKRPEDQSNKNWTLAILIWIRRTGFAFAFHRLLFLIRCQDHEFHKKKQVVKHLHTPGWELFSWKILKFWKQFQDFSDFFFSGFPWKTAMQWLDFHI